MSSRRLRDEISMLGNMLGDVICQIHGQQALDLVENIRTLSRNARGGDAAAATELCHSIDKLDLEEMRIVIRAFSVFLDLTNLAEDRERIRVLQERKRTTYPKPHSESIPDAVCTLQAEGTSATEIQHLVDQLDIELVLTAHPTEAKRKSLRSKLREIRQLLNALDHDDSPLNSDKVKARLRSDLVKLWQTDFVRPWRPSVLQEVERGLAVAPILWEIVPPLADDLRHALSTYYPDHDFNVRPFIRYGSWIGGDRDGHPYVTVEVTSQTLLWLRETALRFHLRACEELSESLSMSKRQSCISSELTSAINTARSSWPELRDSLASIPPNEVYRRHLHLIHWRLERTKEVQLDQGLPIGAYRSSAEFQEDVEIMARSLRVVPTQEICESEVEPWCDRIATFGFHLARLDVRQDSGVHAEVIDELFRDAGVAENYSALDEAGRQQILIETLGRPFGWNEAELSEPARETLALFRLLRRTARRFGMDAIGGHVVSMTRTPSDLLTVLWLWLWSASVDGGDANDPELRLPIIPLYETVDDLANSAATTEAVLAVAEYRQHVTGLGDRQIIMIGYSDSTKDGGYLAACWALYRAQREIFEVAERHGIHLTFFHGRGGSLGRGGGPAARGIRSLPSRTFNGSLRLTEQGEVLAERYDDGRIASRHLEQLAWAALLSAKKQQDDIEAEWTDVMEQLSRRSRVAYRHLVEHDGFVEFFRRVTPISEIESLPIGSRPSRRKGSHGLKDLRAIPWVFSWTQVRGLIPAWFGVGTAVNELIKQSPNATKQLQKMYREWPFVQAWVDNASLAMSKTDLGVFNQYAELANDDGLLELIAKEISAEFAATQQALSTITEREELLGGVQWLDESIRVRNRYVDPINLIQVNLLRRLQTQAEEAPDTQEIHHLIKLSIKGIAAGMRTTG